MVYELGIIGSGNMAEAIVRAVIKCALLRPRDILAADAAPQRRELFAAQLGVNVCADNAAVARQCRCILLSVKPQQMRAALEGIGSVLDPEARIVSIMAGVSSAAIAQHLGQDRPWRIVRTMPNTPVLVGQGMVAIAAGRHAAPEDLAAVRRLFEAGASVIEVSEDQIDVVTALSGSGPAYFFYFVEQMIRAGVELGLPAEQSRLLAIKTAVGSAAMLASAVDSPQELRRKVTSPGGTTQAAIECLEKEQVGAIFVNAIRAAAARSRELGKALERQ